MKIRSPEDYERFKLALVPVDRAMFESEQKWGVGRLERLMPSNILMAWKRGWDLYRVAVEECDFDAVEKVGPRMISDLAFMDGQATAAGHQPLAPDTWEAPCGDGTTLVVCRTSAEASAVIRASNASDGQSFETTLPPDLGVTVRNQHEGRALVVVTLAEIAQLMKLAEAKVLGTRWEGNAAHSGVQQHEMAAHDLVRSGFPLSEAIAADIPPTTGALDF